MAGGIVEKNIDEQIVFEQLKTNKDAVWSLLLASGYLRVEAFRTEGRLNKKIYSLIIDDKKIMNPSEEYNGENRIKGVR